MKQSLTTMLFILCSIYSFGQCPSPTQHNVGTYSYLPDRPAKPDWSKAENPTEIEELNVDYAVSLYIPVPNSANNEDYARARVLATSPEAHLPVMVRAFDRDERLIHSEFAHSALPLETIVNPEDDYVFDSNVPPQELPIASPINNPGGNTVDAHFSMVGQGVHQIRVTAGGSGSKAQVVLSEDLDYGVSFQNGRFSNWNGADKYYIFIPQHAEQLKIKHITGSVVFEDHSPTPIIRSPDSDGVIAIGPSDHNKIWTVSVSPSFSFQAYGMPLILCTTFDAAEEIKASVRIYTDPEDTSANPQEVSVSHLWQEKLLDIRKELLTDNPNDPDDGIGDPSDIIPNTFQNTNWINDDNTVERKVTLMGYRAVYNPTLFEALRRQHTAPDDYWGGVWGKCKITGSGNNINVDWDPVPTGNWDNFLRTDAIGPSGYAESLNLAFLATLNENFNEFGYCEGTDTGKRQRELLRRCAANLCLVMCKLGEAETFPSYDFDKISAHPAFVLGGKVLPEFLAIVPYMEPHIQEIFIEGMRHVMDRHMCDPLRTSSMNQSAHFLSAFESFAEVTGNQNYIDLSKVFADRFIAAQTNAGYFQENKGPDGGYTGMTHYNMAHYYQMTKKAGREDTGMKTAIDKSYEFFNSTVAPEPGYEGKVVMAGGNNFNHRIVQGFMGELWNGARDFVKTEIPSVGKWSILTGEQKLNRLATNKTTINNALGLINAGDIRTKSGHWSSEAYTYYQESDTDCDYIWPAEREPFIEQITRQMVIVKREEYYTNIYIGSPINNVNPYLKAVENARVFFPVEENPGGDKTATSIKTQVVGQTAGGKDITFGITPYVGGGISTFWNKDYGTSVMATNWSPAYHNGLVATKEGKRYWEQYDINNFDNFELDVNDPSLTVTGLIENQAITYKRRYDFYDGYLKIKVECEGEIFSLQGFYEGIPLLYGENKKLKGRLISNGVDQKLNDRTYYQLTNEDGYGTKILFNKVETVVEKNGVLGSAHNTDPAKNWGVDHLEMNIPIPETSNATIADFGYHIIPINEFTKGMVGQWRWKDEGRDNAGYDLHANNTGTPTFDVLEDDCRFVSITEGNYMRTPDFTNSTEEISVTTWLRNSAPSWNTHIGSVKEVPGIVKEGVFELSPKGVKSIEGIIYTANGGTVSAIFDLSQLPNFDLTKWHFYTMTYSLDGLKLYVDGQLAIATNNYSGAIKSENSTMYFGWKPNVNIYIDCDFGETRLYEEALSGDLISKLYLKNNCEANPARIAATEETISEPEAVEPSFKIYPNPTSSNIVIAFEGSLAESDKIVQIFNLMGENAAEFKVPAGANNVLLETNKLPVGTYFIKIQGTNYAQKVMIVR